MQGTKEIKRRIRSIKSTKKITKAMELVAASKMKRAVSATLASRLYAEYSWEILASIGANADEVSHPFFQSADRARKNAGKRPTLLILITSNRGLCGAYNAQVIKKAVGLMQANSGRNDIEFLAVGKRGDAAIRRVGGKVIASFTDLPANLSLRDALPVSKLALGEYAAGRYEKVLAAYTGFRSAISQVPGLKQIVPVSKTDLRELIDSVKEAGSGGAPSPFEIELSREGPVPKGPDTDYLIEGDRDALLSSLAEKIVQMQVYQMLLESNASEQSARMVAMKNASDAAEEVIGDLTLAFNKARQAGITQEISEISAGMTSIS